MQPIALTWHGNYETSITFDNQENWKILKGHEVFKNMSIEELMELEGL